VEPELEVIGDAIFDARTFVLPSIGEAANYLIWRQQDCLRDAISEAASEALATRFGKRAALKLLYKKTVAEKKDLLLKQVGIDFEEFYPEAFRKGVAAYKVPTLIPAKEGIATKNKWVLNDNVPLFAEEKDFVYNILLNGHDVFRAPNVLPLETPEGSEF
jgi:tRNA(His) 5'-end guanylyltransferase